MEIEKTKNGKKLLGTSLFGAAASTHKTTIIAHKRSIMGILTYNAPAMLSKGRKIKTSAKGK